MLIRSLRLDGFLSFAPGSEPFEMRPLNVLIGPNGAGKSNLIDALEMLAAAPEDRTHPLKRREGLREWLWRGEPETREAEIEVVLGATSRAVGRRLRCRLTADSLRAPLEMLAGSVVRATRHAPPRGPQRADLPDDRLLPDGSNLALVLNRIEQAGDTRLGDLVRKSFPRFERFSTRISDGTAQFWLHETDFTTRVPPTRLSDGMLRLISLLAALFSPSPPPLLCIEEPELGLHPDTAASLAEVLIEASGRMQLVVTTHSASLLSGLSTEPDTVVTCERPGDRTVLERLDPEKLAFWLDDYTLGDVWLMGAVGANP